MNVGLYEIGQIVELSNRLLAKIKVNAVTGCWDWAGALSHGYGAIRINGKTRRAHCVSYELNHGPIPSGSNVCHRCDNPSCINPDHLFLGSPRVNMADKVSKGRQHRLRGVDNGQAKLTEADIRDIRAVKGMSLRKIAKRYGVAHCTIFNIRSENTWSHVSGAK